MAKKRASSGNKLDNFAEIYAGLASESGAGTLTFSAKLDLGYSLGDYVGLVLHRIEISVPQNIIGYILDDSDGMLGGLVTSNALTAVAPNNPGVIDFWKIQRQKYGTAAVGWDEIEPQIIKDYTNLPGGGLLIPPNPLYMAIQGVSLASTVVYYYRLYYTTIALNDAGFRELWETWNALRI